MDFGQAHNKVARARGTLLTCAAVVAVVVLYVLRYGDTTGAGAADEALAEQVRTVIAATLARQSCTSPAAAVPAMRSALDAAGFVDWTVQSGRPVRNAVCVTATIHQERREVLLIPALRPEVRSALDELTEDLYVRCLDRDAAVALVTTTLRTAGEVDFEIRTNGPVTAPVDRREQIAAHVAAGCWIYAGTGWQADGMRLYYVSGKGAD
jgi:hypothetical protein